MTPTVYLTERGGSMQLDVDRELERLRGMTLRELREEYRTAWAEERSPGPAP
jgi:hypothetical protein